MTQDMVSALIGRPNKVYWDNSEKTMFHAVYEYEVYKCSFSFTMESPQRTGDRFRESSKSNVEAKYAASVSVYFYMNNGKWTVFKVIGSPKEYKAYRENNYNPLRRMSAPDDAVLVEKYCCFSRKIQVMIRLCLLPANNDQERTDETYDCS